MDIVFSDLDGTLLDVETYSYEPALPAIARLRNQSVPLVFCTSKTRRETEYWRERIGNGHPFIVEDGGAAYVPEPYFGFALAAARRSGQYLVLQLGAAYGELVQALEAASAESGCRVRGFHQMTAQEIGSLCGLTPAMAEMAKDREFDEPFLVLDAHKERALLAAIEMRGRRTVRGGRFRHILGDSDKAGAVSRLMELYRRTDPHLRAIGLGDGLNDAAFLNAVDTPVLVRTPWLEELQALVPRGTPTLSPGPAGWNEAITALFSRDTPGPTGATRRGYR